MGQLAPAWSAGYVPGIGKSGATPPGGGTWADWFGSKLDDAGVGGDLSGHLFRIPEAPDALSLAQDAASWPDARLWGVAADGETDDTDALKRAFASGYPLRMPNGTMRVTDAIPITTQGFKCWFPNHTTGGFAVSTDFNMGAVGVVSINVPVVGVAIGLQQGPILENLRVKFAQPDSVLKSAMTQYPPGVYVESSYRTRFINPRMIAGWDGMVFDGDCGGAIVEYLESFCFNHNVAIDGSADFMRFIGTHIWPFETTVNQIAAFMDPTTTGYFTGRCDGLIVFGGLTICPLALDMHQGSKLGTALQGTTFGAFLGHGFDTFGGIKATGNGWMTFNGGYITLGPFTTPGGVKTPQFGVQKNGSFRLIFNGVKFLQAGLCTAGYVIADLTDDAVFTASIAGTTMTVTSVVGEIEPGTYFSGSGVSAGNSISSQLNGTPGGTGQYMVAIAQTLASTPNLTSTITAGCIVLGGSEGDQGAVDQLFYLASGKRSKFICTGNEFNRAPNIGYLNTTILFEAGRGVVSANDFSPIGSGSGNCIAVTGAGVKVIGFPNNLGGWTAIDESGGSSNFTEGNLA